MYVCMYVYICTKLIIGKNTLYIYIYIHMHTHTHIPTRDRNRSTLNPLSLETLSPHVPNPVLNSHFEGRGT